MSTIATWRTTPLTEKQSKRLDLGLETLNNTTDKVQKEIYSLLKTSLLDGRMKRKSKTLLSEHLQGVNGNPYGFIGFIHKLFDQTNATIHSRSYTWLYQNIFGKSLSVMVVSQLTGHFGTIDHETHLPDWTPNLSVASNTTALDLRSVLKDYLGDIKSRLADLENTVLSLSKRERIHEESLTKITKEIELQSQTISLAQTQICELEDQVQEIEQSNVNSTGTLSLEAIHQNLPPNTQMTLTINKEITQ